MSWWQVLEGDASLNVLFIGNSFTVRNDLPGLIAEMAAERGKTLCHSLKSRGGALLCAHWNAGEALEAIKRGRYDSVVLQEQSTLPIKNARRMHENLMSLRRRDQGCGRQDGALHDLGSTALAELSKRSPTHTPASAASWSAAVVPVGLAWERFFEKNERPMLFDKDGSHPSLAGSYLAGCVFLAVLLEGKSGGGWGSGSRVSRNGARRIAEDCVAHMQKMKGHPTLRRCASGF